jgi:hypothetical protein
MNERINARHNILKKPVEEQFEIVFRVGKSLLIKHILVDTNTEEYLNLVETGKLLLSICKRIEMLPALHEMDAVFRKKLMPGVKHNKNPDYKIDGSYWELEQPTSPYNYRKIDQRIRKGYQQANKIILSFKKHVNGFTVQKAVDDRMYINKELSEVIIIVKGQIAGHIKRKPGK